MRKTSTFSVRRLLGALFRRVGGSDLAMEIGVRPWNAFWNLPERKSSLPKLGPPEIRQLPKESDCDRITNWEKDGNGRRGGSSRPSSRRLWDILDVSHEIHRFPTAASSSSPSKQLPHGTPPQLNCVSHVGASTFHVVLERPGPLAL